jgi:hypothetical protein
MRERGVVLQNRHDAPRARTRGASVTRHQRSPRSGRNSQIASPRARRALGAAAARSNDWRCRPDAAFPVRAAPNRESTISPGRKRRIGTSPRCRMRCKRSSLASPRGQRPRDNRRDGEPRPKKRGPRHHAFDERMTLEKLGFPKDCSAKGDTHSRVEFVQVICSNSCRSNDPVRTISAPTL